MARRLGLSVSRPALGTMLWGSVTDEETCRDLLTAYLEAGGSLVDTAHSYVDTAHSYVDGGAAATGLGVSVTEVALAWVRDRPGVTAPVVGSRTPTQLKAALASEDLELPAEIGAALDEVSD